MEPFKNQYNKKVVESIGSALAAYDKSFNQTQFKKDILRTLSKLEMKQRVELIANSMYEHLSGSDKLKIKNIVKAAKKEKFEGFILWPFTFFVEAYGLSHFKESTDALYYFTQKFTAEFAIRNFIQEYEVECFKLFNTWVKDPCEHIRRLVSEGTRPNLPWGKKVNSLNKNLERSIKLILKLKSDPSEYVRRSVANHLNDISHLDPKRLLEVLDSIQGTSSETDWVIRHASRTLLKKGNPGALKLHGYNPQIAIKSSLKLEQTSVQEGNHLPVRISLKSQSSKKEKIIVDYIIHFLKSNGSYSQKPFRLRDTYIDQGEKITIDKKISLKKVTTRKHYPGKHFLQIQINGQTFQKKAFTLTI